MERISVDILGGLPVTENGNKYIWVISDYFTQSTGSFAMPNMEARTCKDYSSGSYITLRSAL